VTHFHEACPPHSFVVQIARVSPSHEYFKAGRYSLLLLYQNKDHNMHTRRVRISIRRKKPTDLTKRRNVAVVNLEQYI
jgi:hypothetical protein